MAFHNVLLPDVYSYRSRQELVSTIAEFQSDNRDRFVFPTHRALFRYQLTYENRPLVNIKALRHFWYSRRGGMHTFRFFDPVDFTTAPDGISAHTGGDQPLVFLNSKWYLAKNYGTYARIIKLPVSGTVIIKDGASVVTGSCTINYFTGEVTGYTPTGAFTAGFQFHNPVRFTKEPFDTKPGDGITSTCTIGLAEVLEDLQ